MCSVLLASVAILASTVSASAPTQALVFASDTASGQAAIAALANFNVPYIAYSAASSTAYNTLPLTDSLGNANFSMIVLGSGVLPFSSAQWTQLYTYQNTYNVRLVSLYDVPGVGAADPYTTTDNFASNSFSLSPYDNNNTIAKSAAGLSDTYSISFSTSNLGSTYPAKLINTTAVTPILSFVDASTNATTIAACLYTFSQTQQQLSFFYQIAAWEVSISTNTVAATVSSYTDAIWISWASNGTFAVSTPVTTTATGTTIASASSLTSTPTPTSVGPFYVEQNALIISTG
ncbi:hypothetical protein HK100_009753, partial [Physocladia obscura]